MWSRSAANRTAFFREKAMHAPASLLRDIPQLLCAAPFHVVSGHTTLKHSGEDELRPFSSDGVAFCSPLLICYQHVKMVLALSIPSRTFGGSPPTVLARLQRRKEGNHSSLERALGT